MQLIKLDTSFYLDNPSLPQALDYDHVSGVWNANKVRGHGIVSVNVNGLLFAIPVRSHIKHKAGFILEKSLNANERGMGLDYSKALLITDPLHLSDQVFVLKNKTAGKKLVGKEPHITAQFQKYVTRYVDATQKTDLNILNSAEYRFTTLCNYHLALGL